MSNTRFPSYFIPHGAGPCFFMEWNPLTVWDATKDWLSRLIDDAGARPKALVVISGHWETPQFTINSARQPQLLFDYYGFPAHTYQLTWPASGSVELTGRIANLLAEQNIAHNLEERDFDHGVFIPLKVAIPNADIPVVQLSLRQDMDPQAHIEFGRALAPLRDEGVLIVGTGMSFHNMQRFHRSGDSGAVDPDSISFNQWLAEAVAANTKDREQRLSHWATAPGARGSHPREEHLLPLHVAAGAALGDAGKQVFQDTVMGTLQSAFRFGQPVT